MHSNFEKKKKIISLDKFNDKNIRVENVSQLASNHFNEKYRRIPTDSIEMMQRHLKRSVRLNVRSIFDMSIV
jgi:hypothetical protein